VSSDLLVGIFAGILAKLIINTSFVASIQEIVHADGSFLAAAARMFRNPIVNREMSGNEYHLTADKPLVCFNALQFGRELTHIPSEATKVVLHIGNGVTLVDHTTCENLTNTVEDSNREGKITFEIDGWDRLLKRSYYRTATHTLDIERAQIVNAD
jgi:carbonic anhydrase